LPNRLAYPEVLPERYHGDFLYETQQELVDKLMILLTGYHRFQDRRSGLMEAMGVHAWERAIPAYDRVLAEVAMRQ
jgi:hypothetical protein